MTIEIRVYETPNGRRPFEEWFKQIDRHARSRVQVALGRLESGNTGQLKAVGAGVSELRISFGPGYRLYLGQQGTTIVILLTGGTKHRQSEDIARAKELWRAYLDETQDERRT